MNREEKLADMMVKAKKLGLELRFENGLLAIRQKRALDDDALETAMGGFAERAAEIRSIAECRAIVERAPEFIGSRIWVHGYGEGTLDGVGSDGRLFVRVRPEGADNLMNVTATADTIVILDERPSAVPAPAQTENNSEPSARKPFLQTVRDKIRGEA